MYCIHQDDNRNVQNRACKRRFMDILTLCFPTGHLRLQGLADDFVQWRELLVGKTVKPIALDSLRMGHLPPDEFIQQSGTPGQQRIILFYMSSLHVKSLDAMTTEKIEICQECLRMLRLLLPSNPD